MAGLRMARAAPGRRWPGDRVEGGAGSAWSVGDRTVRLSKTEEGTVYPAIEFHWRVDVDGASTPQSPRRRSHQRDVSEGEAADRQLGKSG